MGTKQRKSADTRIIEMSHEVCAIYERLDALTAEYDTFPDDPVSQLLDRAGTLTRKVANTKSQSLAAVAAKMRLIQVAELDEAPAVVITAVNEFIALWGDQSINRLAARLEASDDDTRCRVGNLQLVA